MRAQALPLGGQVEAWGAVDAAGVEQGQGGQTQAGALLRQLLRQGSTLQEAEGGAGVKLGVHKIIESLTIDE